MPEYQQCTKCIMDTTDTEIVFDKNGVCNHCLEYIELEKKAVLKGEAAAKKIEEIVGRIKDHSKGKKYDCAIGVSGGVDSSYLIWYLKTQLGLNPLAIHFDSGWNSEIAVSNVYNIVRKLDIDLHTHVIDWEKFKDLQLAYFKASVLDIDVPADYLIFASLFKVAAQNKIKYLISGSNIVTEAILPKTWTFRRKFDKQNLLDIHRQFGSKKLKNFPMLGKWERLYYNKIKKLEYLHLLNYIDYNKKDAVETIKRELGWKDYGGKHFESIFTRFYQGYILPVKFNIDKRKAHLSNLIVSGQMTREEALKELEQNPYTEEMIKADKQFFIKKFGLTEAEFDKIMAQPIRAHEEFAMERSIYESYPFLRFLKPVVDRMKA